MYETANTPYTQARLIVNVSTASASINSPRIKAKFSTSLNYATDTVANMTDLGTGTTEIACSMAVAGIITSTWINIHTSAKPDVFVVLTQVGGDGTITPRVGSIIQQLK